ncbi:MAG: nitrite reductase [Saprospiraceae bacterium]
MIDNVPMTQIAPEDRADILELDERIKNLHNGTEDEERFRHYRLTRGVYGQRQANVQMFRTKIPFGKLTTGQLEVLATLADRYSNGKLHLTTRQNVQFHYVKLEDSVKVWMGLAKNGMTGREACGNTVRNITASATAGIDPDEPFDVSPYVQATFEYFLRNPICQEMGRKIKTSFSSSEKDTAFGYFHDFGFIPKVKIVKGREVRGFKVLLGGGLGAQAMPAYLVHDFLEEDQIIPFKEAAVRVFDRYGERAKRFKARMKFLLKDMGVEGFLSLVEKERKAIRNQRYLVDRNLVHEGRPAPEQTPPTTVTAHPEKFEIWKKTNVFEQKQKGYYGVFLNIRLGNLSSRQARQLAAIARAWAANDIRITVNQGLLLRFVRAEALPHLHNELDATGLGEAGFFSAADITACPGTDTCALGVTNSTGLAIRLEKLIREEYPHLLEERLLKINISGCMNSCGQHISASIGFHGSSIRQGAKVVPAMQVVLGGGVDPDGTGRLATKIIKLPAKRIPNAVRLLLDDFAQHGGGEYFNAYFRNRGQRYFYDLLKPLASTGNLDVTDFFDWGQSSEYVQSIGTGECAGVAFDVAGAIIGDAQKKIEAAETLLADGAFTDAIYIAYTAFITGAKALLLAEDIRCNTHINILDDFQKHFVETGAFTFSTDFPHHVLRLNEHEPEADFASQYIAGARSFLSKVIATRLARLAATNGEDKVVMENYRA